MEEEEEEAEKEEEGTRVREGSVLHYASDNLCKTGWSLSELQVFVYRLVPFIERNLYVGND